MLLRLLGETIGQSVSEPREAAASPNSRRDPTPTVRSRKISLRVVRGQSLATPSGESVGDSPSKIGPFGHVGLAKEYGTGPA